MMSKLKVIPIHINRQAAPFIKKYHRHNLPSVGGKFAIGCMKDGVLVGVAVCGRPISRKLDNGKTCEILRVCTDGTDHVPSFLYAKCRKIAYAMGYEKVITYTLQSESGISLKAAGAMQEKLFEGKQWTEHPNVKRNKHPVHEESKIRWVV